MKIKAGTILKDLSGKDLDIDGKPFTLGQALGNILVASDVGGKMKLYLLGSQLYQGKDVTVDEADLLMIKQAVNKTATYSAIVAGQCEQLLEAVK